VCCHHHHDSHTYKVSKLERANAPGLEKCRRLEQCSDQATNKSKQAGVGGERFSGEMFRRAFYYDLSQFPQGGHQHGEPENAAKDHR
jgi:hypothetical protein